MMRSRSRWRRRTTTRTDDNKDYGCDGVMMRKRRKTTRTRPWTFVWFPSRMIHYSPHPKCTILKATSS